SRAPPEDGAVVGEGQRPVQPTGDLGDVGAGHRGALYRQGLGGEPFLTRGGIADGPARAAPREHLAPVGQGEGVEEFIDDGDDPPPGVRLDGGGAAERRAVPEGGALVIPPPEEPPGGGDR